MKLGLQIIGTYLFIPLIPFFLADEDFLACLLPVPVPVPAPTSRLACALYILRRNASGPKNRLGILRKSRANHVYAESEFLTIPK